MNIGIEYFQRTVEIDDKSLLLQVWDTSGQEKYRAISASFIKRADAVLLTYAIDDRDSFKHVVEWIKEIKDNTAEDVCIILVGSKADVGKRCVEYVEGEELARELGVQFFETSAKENMNIDQVFMTAAQQIKKKLEGPTNSMNSMRTSCKISAIKKSGMDVSKHQENVNQGGGCCGS